MKNLTLKKILSWLLLIIWMSVIFVFSHKSGNDSDKQSTLIINIFNVMGLDLNSTLGDLATFIVRKTAHFTEYMILFFLSYNLLRSYTDKKDSIMFALIITLGYACTDEVHQLFIPGRTGKFTDILIDISGGLFGAFILSITKDRQVSSFLNLRR
ncbi:teicoplanin resistance protein VanZ [Clostridium polyendosporum]|uniref:Teicoplanin resistance protein VanZ n=1 Tax=Clostridium polyendosporum TaxID=69208 RepID=A0A919S2X8_9CLOT|nr:VanZ family protein [Clostridium polyendosporum]GIM30499.1 teicoplanin resistance protein VanZ [Clostridium polyendosporum]